MATAGHYSPENEYFCRYFRLVNETSAKPLRKIIENTAAVRPLAVHAFLLCYKTKMQILFNRGVIQKHQFDKMYPKAGTFCIENLDISLLCVILTNTCNVSQNGKAAYEDIRKYRNELCHNPVIALPRLDYYSKFSNVHSAIKVLLQECQDVTFEAEIENEIKNIDESPVSVSVVMNLFKDFLFAQDSEMAHAFSERFRQLEASVTEMYTTTNENLKVIYSTVEKQPMLTAKAVQSMLQADTRREDVNPMIGMLSKHTEEVLKKKSEYVLTQQFLEAESMLLSSGSVVISGGAGEGKTYAAYEIMRRNVQENNCIQIHSPDDVRFLDTRKFDFVFIDDIFGNYEVDESKLQSWIHVMDKLQQLVNVKALYLIIVTREIVLRECKEKLGKFSIFKQTLSLSSKRLSQEEKTEILKKNLTNKQKNCSIEEIQRCVTAFTSSSGLGFPYTCVLFASDDNFFNEGPSFFRHNPFLSLGVFTKLHDCKQLALLFLWIKDATSPVALNRNKENDTILKKIGRILNYEYAIDMLYDQINNECKKMDGVFVNAGPYGYQFTHNAVYQSIGSNFAHIGHYNLVIEYSNLAFFMEAISVFENHYQCDRVLIRSEHYHHLVERIKIEVMNRNHCREMAMHPCLTSEVLCILVKTLKREKIFKDFFFCEMKSRSSESEPSRSNTFLSYYLETCVPESCAFLKQVHDQIKCAKLFHNRRQCRICEFYLEAYHGACRGGNIEALKILNFVKCDSSILRDAAFSGNILMYEYIAKVLGLKKDAENEKKSLYVAIEKKDLEMYDFIRHKGCRPDSKCLELASKLRSSKLLVHIIRDMHVSGALKEDENVKYLKGTLFSMDVLETFILVGLCPTKEDIVRSMSVDQSACESILWDLKYKVNGKTRNMNAQVTKLWNDIIEDPDLTEKLEEIGLLKTSSYLDRQVQKGNSEKVEHIIQQLQRNNDWDPKNYFAVNLLNLCLPDHKDMFKYLLNNGVIPRYSTLFKSIETKDIKIVKMTIGKMKENGTFDQSHRASKKALLQSALSCDIYNCLIEEGIEPKAYHLLYIVESDADANTKIEVIKNVYLMADRYKCLMNFDKNVMQLALLGAFDDIKVYTQLLKKPFRLPCSNLPTLVSRGRITQVERFIEYLKSQEDWPPSYDATRLSLQCSFYNPGMFEILMKEVLIDLKSDNHKLLAYTILFDCRMHSFHKIKEYIAILQKNNIWNPNDIVLKCCLLESSEDESACGLLKQNGVVAEDILNTARETGNSMLQSYITAYLSEKGYDIDLRNLDEEMIKSLSNFPLLCTGQLLQRAVCVCDKEVVMNIFDTLSKTDPDFVGSALASNILEHSSKRLDIYRGLLDKGFCPTPRCLLTVLKRSSYELFKDTIEYLDKVNKLPRAGAAARKLVHESLKRDSTDFYLTLTRYGITGTFEDIVLALNADNIPICHVIVDGLDKDLLEECPEGIHIIILKCFPLYRRMHEKGLKVTPSVLLRLTHSYLHGQIRFHNIRCVFTDYFFSQNWSFEDDDLSNIYRLSRGNGDLLSLLDIYFKSEKESDLLQTLMSRDNQAVETYLNNDPFIAKRVLPGVIRKSVLSRKRLDRGCRELILEWIEENECDPTLRILSSVLYSNTENTLEMLYELSEEMRTTPDTEVLETALEEAIFHKKTGLYCSILKECRVKPTTYCLLYSIHHNNDACFKITLKKLPKVKKTCLDPYYKASLALCCQRSDLDKFKTLLDESKLCDSELVFEAVLCKNELIFKLVQQKLITNNQWDFSLKEYWIASAFIEAGDNDSMKDQFESYYDDVQTIYEVAKDLNRSESTSEDEDNDEVSPEQDYEDLNSFILRENAYKSLQHIQRIDI